MRKLLYLAAGGALLAGISVWAHDDFEVDDPVQPGADTQQVVVPGDESTSSNDMNDSYQRALDAAQRSGNINLVQQLMESKNAPSGSPRPAASPTPVVSVVDLPFSLLAISLDRDQDGLSDNEEIRLVTNASQMDTDGDNYADGIEVVRGYNPLVASPNDKVTYEEPTVFNAEQYRITGIRLGDSANQERLTVTGLGPVDSLIALLVRGDANKLWVTRTDKTGRFIYVSSDTLDVGNYKIHAAAVSVDGKTLAASQALAFQRTDDALVKIEPAPTPVSNNENDSNRVSKEVIGVAVAAVAGLALGLLLWLIVRRRRPRAANRLPLT